MKTAAIVSALAAVAVAAPHAKREIVWETNMVTKTEIVDSTVTVWVNAADMTASPSAASDMNAAAKVFGLANQKNAANGYGQGGPPRGDNGGQAPASSVSTVFIKPADLTTTTTTTPAPAPPTTTPYVAPAPTTTPYVAPPAPTTTPYVAPPAPTTTPYVAPAPTSAAPPQSYSPPSSGGGGGSSGCAAYSPGATCSDSTFSYYTPGLGACGLTSTDSDYIFAYSSSDFDAVTGANPNNSPLCGKSISITAYDGSKITAKLVDRCPGCGTGQLDLSPGLWDRVSKGDPNANGLCHGYTWTWL